MSSVMKREKVSQICVVDPYYMHESFLSLGDFEGKTAREYLENLMIRNNDQEIVLLHYHSKSMSDNPFVHFNHSFSLIWRII